jgi:hypothetical protein
MDDAPLYPECPHCGDAILPWDDRVATNDGALPWHRECLMRGIVGSVGHQLGRCRCFGGTEDDPPGMTPREAARASMEMYEERMRWAEMMARRILEDEP